MKKYIFIGLFYGICVLGLHAQSAIYVPNSKSIKPNPATGLIQPESFILILEYKPEQPTYTLEDIDLLDSVYRIAFSRENPMMYTVTIEGYGNATNQNLIKERVQGVHNYFTNRSNAQFMIRIAPNPISSNCYGDSIEMVRYEVPTDLKYYDIAQLPASKAIFNKTPLDGKVKITFTNNPKACVGDFEGCSLPTRDSIIRSYYSSVTLAKGSLQHIRNTKAECVGDVEFSIEEHLDYREILNRYFLVPHDKQIIVQVGYIVLHSNYKKAYNECTRELPDSIFVTFPVTQAQFDNRLRVFGKKYTEKGAEFKSLITKKLPSDISLSIRAAINPTQIDTLFLAKRININELDDYFFRAKTDIEEGAFTVKGNHYKAYRYNKRGEYELKKPLRLLFRMEDDVNNEEIEDSKIDKKYVDDEIIED